MEHAPARTTTSHAAAPMRLRLPSPTEQAHRLVQSGAIAVLDRPVVELHEAARALETSAGSEDVLLVPRSAPDVPGLLQHVHHGGKPGFVVADMTDVDAFAPTPAVPEGPWYGLVGPRRGDELRDVSPADAAARIAADGRTPLTILEGVLLLVQVPDALARNHCFMTIGSRVRKADGRYDSRTPALWVSNGTGRDGAERRDAPKLGWCWWNNRHTWLGIGHAERRIGLP